MYSLEIMTNQLQLTNFDRGVHMADHKVQMRRMP